MAETHVDEEPTRRDFLYVATGAFAAAGAAAVAWPLIDQMNPSAAVQALASIDVTIGDIPVGQEITVQWRGKPVFIRHRTEEEIQAAETTPLDELRDPVDDAGRVKVWDGKLQKEWLVVIGICTHLGCVPLSYEGRFDGWFCPCHGSGYDTAGRIRYGPAPANLVLPPYEFTSAESVKIG